jgi:hypothetical protein
MRVHWFGALQTESVGELVPQGRDEESDSAMSLVCYRDSLASSGLTAFSLVGLVRNDRCQPDCSAVIALMKASNLFHTWADLLACGRRLTA